MSETNARTLVLREADGANGTRGWEVELCALAGVVVVIVGDTRHGSGSSRAS